MTITTRKALGADFLLGVATSSYQIEGAVAADGRLPSIWDVFSHTPGKTKNADTGDVACDHYNRLESDLDLLAWMGVDAYRFSIAWPRVVPTGDGSVNEKGLEFYERVVDGLLARGIKPCPTLYHWDLPAALPGGWLNPKVTDAFARYARIVAARLGDRIPVWFTHNEPWCQAFMGYELGKFAPGHTDLSEALTCAHHLLVSHGKAVRALREVSDASVGPALNFLPIHPASSRQDDLDAARRHDGYFNRWFVDPISGRGYPQDMVEWYGKAMPNVSDEDLETIAQPIDVMGVNYYERAVVEASDEGMLKLSQVRDTAFPRTADREVYPPALGELLRRLAYDYGYKRMIITENGAAFLEAPSVDGMVMDDAREDFIDQHLQQVVASRTEGIGVDGYFAWSLLDNFEWAEGYDMRYGIVHVDLKTQRRTPKKSAHFLRSLARNK
jgi:beta-glucosidase